MTDPQKKKGRPSKPAKVRTPGQRDSTRAGREKLPACGATNRQGKPCERPAGWGTAHPGDGRCKLHGGVGQRPSERYLDLQGADRLGSQIERYANDPDPLDLTGELAMLRAILSSEASDYSDFKQALMAWHKAWDGPYLKRIEEWSAQLPLLFMAQVDQKDWPKPPHPEDIDPKPRSVPQLADLSRVVKEIGVLAQRIHDMRKQGSISMAKLNGILDRLGGEAVEAAREVIADEAVRARFLASLDRRWADIDTDDIPEAPSAGPEAGRIVN